MVRVVWGLVELGCNNWNKLMITVHSLLHVLSQVVPSQVEVARCAGTCHSEDGLYQRKVIQTQQSNAKKDFFIHIARVYIWNVQCTQIHHFHSISNVTMEIQFKIF